MPEIEGFYQTNFNPILFAIDRQQRKREIQGNIAEIGVHEGLSFHSLRQCLRPPESGEKILAVDCFDNQESNVSKSGKGDLEKFRENLGACPDQVEILIADSNDLHANDYRSAVGGPFRIFHIDGGHDYETAFRDMIVAGECLVPGGVLIIDDVFNPHWPEVSRAFYDFMYSSKMIPEAIGFGKVVVSNSAGYLLNEKAGLEPKWRRPWFDRSSVPTF